MRGIQIYLNADPKGPLLLVDPEQVADRAGGLDTGVGGLYAARKAKVPLYRSLGAGEVNEPNLIALEDVHEVVALYKVETAKEKDTRSRYQRYIDGRRAARLAKAQEAARIEKEREEAEVLNMSRGLHGDFLIAKQKAEAAQAERLRRNPVAPELDLDINSWADAGAPEEVNVPPTPPADYLDDEGEVL